MKNIFSKKIKSIVFIGLITCVFSCKTDTNSNFSDTAKVALRDVGHHLLLANKDTTSLVKPVIDLGKSRFQLTFENQLVIHPDTLVNYIKNSFAKAELPKHYLTEVLACNTKEVAYSYQMKQDVEKGIVPCGGRQLHLGCYKVIVKFNKALQPSTSNIKYIILAIIGALGLFGFLLFKRKPKTELDTNESNYQSIGHYKFFPDQNKLIKETTEISLSKKECELLSIFIEKPNQIIKRDELTKKVWEDNGVIVGRSLDTYISKLRKKLQEDPSIKLTNVHGVGYKLEI
ncbi:winged helix-turn-helix domain-containing protein [Olleya sp. R77988]|uniref:winged helix-turn-helix domain-containing protein n=1 Tax=Olleya sp. R77988 TaxID=3093875 RepID=UPI0037C96733